MTYQWFVIVGGIFSFFMSWTIGANDVANSFATAIGAKTLTLFQACCIAACLEFGGAVGLGGEVSKSIAGSITDLSVFEDRPEIFAYGMLCSLLSASLWVTFATYHGLAVSTTHSIIGSVIGYTLVWQGPRGILWIQSTNDFPFVKGLVPIIISWFTSPLLSAMLSIIIFSLNKRFILESKNSDHIAYYALPPLVLITVFINMFFILYKGAKAELHWSSEQSAWVSSIIAGGSCIISCLCIPCIKSRVQKQISSSPTENELNITTLSVIAKSDAIIPIDTTTNSIEMQGKQYSKQTENVYKYLQVFSSCSVAFAHGANDVANAIGPYGAIWYVYENMKLSNEIMTPKWMLVLGGSGIVIGLWTYGYKVIQSLGGKLCYLSPSRGYSAELATALTVSFASVYGIPISTTHCIVGAEVGIGITEGIKTGVNWKLFLKTFTAWIFTLIISGLLSAIFFAQGIYAPTVI